MMMFMKIKSNGHQIHVLLVDVIREVLFAVKENVLTLIAREERENLPIIAVQFV